MKVFEGKNTMSRGYYREFQYCEHDNGYYLWRTNHNGKKYVYCKECKKIVWKQK